MSASRSICTKDKLSEEDGLEANIFGRNIHPKRIYTKTEGLQRKHTVYAKV